MQCVRVAGRACGLVSARRRQGCPLEVKLSGGEFFEKTKKKREKREEKGLTERKKADIVVTVASGSCFAGSQD